MEVKGCAQCPVYDKMACEENCSRCNENNKKIKIELNSDKTCLEEVAEDCGDKICVEHMSDGPWGDISAKCEDCPDSLDFVTSTIDQNGAIQKCREDGIHVIKSKDGDFYQTKNTFLGFKTPQQAFKKISDTCNSNSCAGKKISVSFNNHGNSGFQNFGDNSEITLDIDSLSKINADDYNFNCVKEVIWGACSAGKGLKGKAFMEVSQNFFSEDGNVVEIYAASNLVSWSGEVENGSIVKLGENGEFTELLTIFYLTRDDLIYPGMPKYVYQTEVLEGNPGSVSVYIEPFDGRDKLAKIHNDSLMPCSSEIIDSVEYILTSETREIVLDGLKIGIPEGNIAERETVRVRLNKLATDCSQYYEDNPVNVSLIDEESFNAIKKAYELGLINETLFNKAKLMYKNQWECVDNEDCYGVCPMSNMNCSLLCEEGKCIVSETQTTRARKSIIQSIINFILGRNQSGLDELKKNIVDWVKE